MGRGSYTAADWLSLRSSRNLNSEQAPTVIFDKKTAENIYCSKEILCRRSCDVDEDSIATPIIIGFDVTASMGYLAKELATNSVHNTVTDLLSDKQVSSPQILCAAIGDCKSDKYPLQVTQFESDIRIIKQLLELYLEGGGGGNNGESYNLLWYFASRHIKHDCFEKHKKKAYLFTIGDDLCHGTLSAAEIRRNFQSSSEHDISNEELIMQVRKKYHVFHIHIDKGIPADKEIFNRWEQLLPGCCAPINIKDIDCLSELITAIISITEGKTANASLRRLDQARAEKIARSVAAICPPAENKTISF
ncbi:MAG: hypothetical protein IJB49_07365 [Clostridia bacterium]|nr:hypothetical protein [Clostridia bacterium]